MIAAQQDTSRSALAKRFLLELGSSDAESERLKREERALRGRITNLSGIRPAVPGGCSPPRRISPVHFLDTNILLYSISRHPTATPDSAPQLHRSPQCV
jgi:hypothetical protein